jgi:tRNA pseudouridine55 synthase
VFELALLEASGSVARVRCRCSAGTYLRAIAHDMGRELGCGAHLSGLKRTASGPFTIEQAHSLEALEGNLESAFIASTGLLPEFPAVMLDEGGCTHVRQGRNFPASPFRAGAGSRYVKAVWRDELVAIGERVLPNLYHPVVVL